MRLTILPFARSLRLRRWPRLRTRPPSFACIESLERRTLLAAISGTVFDDLSGNGLREPADMGLTDWTVFLDGNANQQLDADLGEVSMTTNSQGEFQFDGLAAGIYFVAVVPQAGWVQTTTLGGQRSVTVTNSESVMNQDFGEYSSLNSVFWTGIAGDLNWGTAANWSTGLVPNSVNDVFIRGALGTLSLPGISAKARSLHGIGMIELFSGATLTLTEASQTQTVALQSGSLVANSAFDVADFTWRGGTLSGTGTTTVTHALKMQEAGGVTLDGHHLTLTSDGTGQWSTSQRWQFLNQAEFVNEGTFAFLDPAGSPNVDVMQGSGTVRNLGTLRANTTSTAGVDINGGFFNEGTVDLQGGVFRTKGTSSGTLTGAAGTTFLLREFTLTSSSSLVTAGDVIFNGGINTVSGSYQAAEASRFFTATTFLQTPTALGIQVDVNASVDIAGANLTLPQLNLSNGNLLSTGRLSVTDYRWAGARCRERAASSSRISSTC